MIVYRIVDGLNDKFTCF